MKAAAAERHVAEYVESDPDSWNTSGDEGGDPGVETEQRRAGSTVLASKGQDPEEDDNEDGEDEGEGPAAADAERADEYGGDASVGEEEEEEEDVDVDDELDDEFGGEDDEGKEETAAEERRRSQSDASASDSEGGGGMGGEGKGAGDNKAASFARAFAKIMATGGTQKGILSASKSLSKRKREDVEAVKAEKEAKTLRREMRRKGHVMIPKKGEDLQLDMREKALTRIATRGVVRLFNAVAKAQKQQKAAAEAKKGRVAPVSKASFLAELQGQVTKPQASEQMVAAKPMGLVPAAREAVAGASTGRGWAVLQDGLVGAAGTGTRLKDWDKAVDSDEDEDMAAQQQESSDDEPDW